MGAPVIDETRGLGGRARPRRETTAHPSDRQRGTRGAAGAGTLSATSADAIVERDRYHGWPVLDADGEHVGDVDALYEDGRGRPRYLGLAAGLFGGSHTLLPVDLVELDEEAQAVRTPWTRARIKSAPRYDGDEPLDAEMHRAVRDHLGRDVAGPRPPDDAASSAARRLPTGSRTIVEVEVPDPEADSGEVELNGDGSISVPIFEERLVVEKRLVVARRLLVLDKQPVGRRATTRDAGRRRRSERPDH